MHYTYVCTRALEWLYFLTCQIKKKTSGVWKTTRSGNMRTPKHKCALYVYPCLLFRHMERKMREYNYFGCMELYSIEETAQDNWQQSLFGNKVTIDHMIINVKLILLVHSVCRHSYPLADPEGGYGGWNTPPPLLWDIWIFF